MYPYDMRVIQEYYQQKNISVSYWHIFCYWLNIDTFFSYVEYWYWYWILKKRSDIYSQECKNRLFQWIFSRIMVSIDFEIDTYKLNVTNP